MKVRYSLVTVSENETEVLETDCSGTRPLVRFVVNADRTTDVVALVEGVRAGLMPLPVGTSVQLQLGDEIFLPGGAKFTVTGQSSQ